jgi:hypothetical protein
VVSSRLTKPYALSAYQDTRSYKSNQYVLNMFCQNAKSSRGLVASDEAIAYQDTRSYKSNQYVLNMFCQNAKSVVAGGLTPWRQGYIMHRCQQYLCRVRFDHRMQLHYTS